MPAHAGILSLQLLWCIINALCLFLNVEAAAAFQQAVTASMCQMLYLTDGPPQQDVLSQAAVSAASTLVALLRCAVLPPLRCSALAVCRRALAMVTPLSGITMWRQAGHAYALALSYVAVDAHTRVPVLWHLGLLLCCCLFGVATHLEALPGGLDLALLQALAGKRKISCHAWLVWVLNAHAAAGSWTRTLTQVVDNCGLRSVTLCRRDAPCPLRDWLLHRTRSGGMVCGTLRHWAGAVCRQAAQL